MEKVSLKIIHISCYDIGGAAKAALLLHYQLIQDGTDSKFVCLDKYTEGGQVFQFNRQKSLGLLHRAFKKFGFHTSVSSKNDKRLKKYKGRYELFTFCKTDIDILECDLINDADVIHLHWAARYLDYPSFFKNVNKPIVWTLHDKNPTMGGFHLLVDKERNPVMLKLENEVAQEKARWIHRNNNISIVSPSRFLMNYSKLSLSLGRYPHYHIPNAVNLSVFRPQNKVVAKTAFNFPQNKKTILFLNDMSYHKGGDMVWECIRTAKLNDIHFVALGNGHKEENSQISFLNFSNDEEHISLLYSAADAFLLPTREDNLPNMMLESLACGTPVLATPVGGILDTIENGFNGLLSENVSTEAIMRMLERFQEDSIYFNRETIRNFVVMHFSPEMQAGRYLDLYKNILKNASD